MTVNVKFGVKESFKKLVRSMLILAGHVKRARR